MRADRKREEETHIVKQSEEEDEEEGQTDEERTDEDQEEKGEEDEDLAAILGSSGVTLDPSRGSLGAVLGLFWGVWGASSGHFGGHG